MVSFCSGSGIRYYHLFGNLGHPKSGEISKGDPYSNLMWSRDQGKIWTISEKARTNTTESAVVELSDGSLIVKMRGNRNRTNKSHTNELAVSVTKDLDKTWSLHSSHYGDLPEPVCMPSLLGHTLGNGKTLLFFSNSNSKHWHERMTVRISLDVGKTWPAKRSILLDKEGGA